MVARLGDLQVGQAEEVGDRVAGDLDPDGVDDDDAPPFQLCGHLLIGTRGRRGQVPGPPVRVPVAVRHLGQGQVQRLLDGDCPGLS